MSALPTFLIIGAPRSGTTALYEGLKAHRDVFLPTLKEPLFFLRDQRAHRLYSPAGAAPADQAIATWEDYVALFKEGASLPARGDASTLYLYDAHAAQRIADRLPSVRMIALLRDPVSRAYSQYSLHRLRGTEPLPSFEDALAHEPARILGRWSPFWLYRDVGRYAGQLNRYFKLMGRERLLVLLQEDLAQRPTETYLRIFRFLGIPAERAAVPELRSVNASGQARNELAAHLVRSRSPWVRAARRILPAAARRQLRGLLTKPAPEMAPATARELRAFYRDDILETSRLLGRDLSHWLDPDAARYHGGAG